MTTLLNVTPTLAKESRKSLFCYTKYQISVHISSNLELEEVGRILKLSKLVVEGQQQNKESMIAKDG